MKFTLPELNYDYKALEPHIDARTMEIHHQKHHAGYVNNLNNALESHNDYKDWSLEKLLTTLEELPESIRTAVRNNGGGHYNHSLFWEGLVPNGKPISASFKAVLESTFGSYDAFKEQFKNAATKRFGSGWAWLVIKDGKLEIVSTPNQDAPVSDGYKELLGLDVWEHAYYLNYQNRRADYIEAFFNVINWSVVEARYDAAK